MVLFGVRFGVLFGVRFGVRFGVCFEVLFGVRFGVRFGVCFEVLFGSLWVVLDSLVGILEVIRQVKLDAFMDCFFHFLYFWVKIHSKLI